MSNDAYSKRQRREGNVVRFPAWTCMICAETFVDRAPAEGAMQAGGEASSGVVCTDCIRVILSGENPLPDSSEGERT